MRRSRTRRSAAGRFLSRHDRRFKIHVPLTLHYRGKADSFYVECSCGGSILVATWYTAEEMQKTEGVWSKERWGQLLEAGRLFLGPA